MELGSTRTFIFKNLLTEHLNKSNRRVLKYIQRGIAADSTGKLVNCWAAGAVCRHSDDVTPVCLRAETNDWPMTV